MEAAVWKPKKQSIKKGKLKKTIKNVICSPDPFKWPTVSKDKMELLTKALELYKVSIPEFIKPHWNQIKLLAKEERPKHPKIQKVNGLIFGLTQCSIMIKNKECSAVLIELNVNPRIIMQSILEACGAYNIPVVCLENLKLCTQKYFGVPTSCLGIKSNCLRDLADLIKEVCPKQENFEMSEEKNRPNNETLDINNETLDKKNETLDKNNEFLDKLVNIEEKESNAVQQQKSLYLYRDNKNSRVFVPPKRKSSGDSTEIIKVISKDKSPNALQKTKVISNDKSLNTLQKKMKFKKMILKRIQSNPNRKEKIK